MKVEIDGEPYTVVSVEFVKPGKAQPFNRTKLKHLMTNRVIEKTFKSGDKVDEDDVTEGKMRMLYKEQDAGVFMDDNSFEQLSISNGIIDDRMSKLEDLFSLRGERPQPLFALVADGRPEELAMAVGSLSLASARGGPDVRPILVAPAALSDRDDAALQALPFACVRFRWRGARAVFDGLDDALE
jgi:translation elongation factor P/translation initiation factor 5A